MRSTLNPFVAVVRAVVVLVGLSIWFLLAGCQTLGPAALGVGRGAYNDVIASTSSEQTVRLRYSDPFDLLMVSSVTAGLKFSAEATGQAGFGPRANYAGNPVPFSAGVSYEDSPTISSRKPPTNENRIFIPVQHDLGFNNSSTLSGNAGQVAKSKLPPAAEKTEKLRGALIPNATVIARPNIIRSIPLHKAVIRVCQPARRRRPNKISAQVEMTASAGIIACGKNQLSLPVYSTNLAKLPQDTFGWPNAPHQPKRSATAESKDRPRANRKSTELKLANLSHHVFICNLPAGFLQVW
jgi:hypothetical protein